MDVVVEEPLIVGEAIGEDGHGFLEGRIVGGIESDGSDLLLDILEELEAELARCHSIAINVDSRHGEHQDRSGGAVVDLADVGCGRRGGLLDHLGEDGIIVDIALVVPDGLADIDLALGCHLAGFGIVGEYHLLAAKVELVVGVGVSVVRTEVLVAGEGDGAAFERALDPCLGQIVAESLEIDIVAVEADVHIARDGFAEIVHGADGPFVSL